MHASETQEICEEKGGERGGKWGLLAISATGVFVVQCPFKRQGNTFIH